VVTKVRERLAVKKQRSDSFHTERFNLKKLKDVEAKEQYRVEISNRFADLDTDVDINTSWSLERTSKFQSKRVEV
jgi:hypothetical protein